MHTLYDTLYDNLHALMTISTKLFPHLQGAGHVPFSEGDVKTDAYWKVIKESRATSGVFPPISDAKGSTTDAKGSTTDAKGSTTDATVHDTIAELMSTSSMTTYISSRLSIASFARVYTRLCEVFDSKRSRSEFAKVFEVPMEGPIRPWSRGLPTTGDEDKRQLTQ
eukprot:8767673-Pyramimonas_sp.AAC.1